MKKSDYYNLIRPLYIAELIPKGKHGTRKDYSELNMNIISKAVEYNKQGLGRFIACKKAVIDIYGQGSEEHEKYLSSLVMENEKRNI